MKRDNFQEWQTDIIEQEYDKDENLFLSNRVKFEMGILEE